MAGTTIKTFTKKVKDLGGNGSINLENNLRYYILSQETELEKQSGKQREHTRSLIARAGGLLAQLEARTSPVIREVVIEGRRRLP